MTTSHLFAALAAVGLAGAALAQEPTTTRPDPRPSTSPTEGTAADQTPPGATSTRDADRTPGATDPRPSTSPTEGTAADTTPPGETATQDAADPAHSGTTDPRPSTSEAEGTAADSTPPGRTSTTTGRAGQTATSEDARNLMGASVVTRSNTPLGEVTDVVFDAKQQPAFIIIQTQNESTAVPYSAAASMMSGDKVVIDQAKLQSAPKVKQGEWRDESSEEWQSEAQEYWDRG